ncbi:hypothetical protein F2Q69_00059506 [Brassica cretica]|uniref:Uncharacterized protein n=1 Tax=Brassica cretica TaxID=69181 RepID=A0A8S9RQM0_BRACR|nr:hypothetical protein F2Q69_00059506 [Brassica cretica]
MHGTGDQDGLVGLYWYVSLDVLVVGEVASWAGGPGTFSCFNMGDRFSLVPLWFLVKRAAAKASTRQGDGGKQQESKGASTLKSGNFKNGLVGLYWYVSLDVLVVGEVASWAGGPGTFSCFNMGDRFSLVPLWFLGGYMAYLFGKLVHVVGVVGGTSLKIVPRLLGNIFWTGGLGV